MPIQARQSECKMPVGTAIAGKPPLSAGRAALCGPQQRSPHGGRRLYSQRFDLIDASARLPGVEISAYIVPSATRANSGLPRYPAEVVVSAARDRLASGE